MTEMTVYDAPRTLEEAAALRAIGPILRVRMPSGGETWMIMTLPLARQVLSDARLGRAPLLSDPNVPYRATFPKFLKGTLLFTDAPDHTRLRRSVARWFTARRIEQLRERTVATANRLLDEVERTGAPADIIEGYAAALPIEVLMNLLGADLSRTDDFLRWSRTLQGTGGYTEEEIERADAECSAYLRGEIEARRTGSGEDVLTVLAQLTDEDGLTDDEILSIAMLLLVAGFDNTANMIGSGVYALLGHPDQKAVYLEDIPGRTASLAEEMLRHGRQSMGSGVANSGVPFVALEDLEIEGVQVRRGEFVTVNRNSANHDESVFERPFDLDVLRAPNMHLGLSYGIHHCLGAPLARMELQVAFSTLFTRFPGLELAGEAKYLPNTISQPIIELPVRW